MAFSSRQWPTPLQSSTLAWKIPWMEEPGGLQSMGLLRVGHDWAIHFHFSLSCIGEGNGNPLQCSCLENPRDGGAWWDAVYGVAESRTRLERLRSSSWFPILFVKKSLPVLLNFFLIYLMPYPSAFTSSETNAEKKALWERRQSLNSGP